MRQMDQVRWFGVAVLAACAVQLPARAETYGVGTNAASGTINRPGPTRDDYRIGNTAVNVSSASSQTEVVPPDGWWSASGSAYSQSTASAGNGAIKLYADSRGEAVNTNGASMNAQAGSSAWGSISDAFVVLAGACADLSACGAGAHGTLTFSIAVSGGAGGSGTYSTTTPWGGSGGWSGVSSWDNTGSVNAGQVPDHQLPSYVEWSRGAGYSANQQGVVYDTQTGGGAGVQTYTIEFVFGQSITFQMLGHAYSSANASADFYASQNGNGASSADATFAADLAHTMGWGGIDELRDAQGRLLTSFTALSAASGFDYRLSYLDAAAVVPEPATTALLIAGLAGLGALAGARRRKSTVS